MMRIATAFQNPEQKLLELKNERSLIMLRIYLRMKKEISLPLCLDDLKEFGRPAFVRCILNDLIKMGVVKSTGGWPKFYYVVVKEG